MYVFCLSLNLRPVKPLIFSNTDTHEVQTIWICCNNNVINDVNNIKVNNIKEELLTKYW